jgi:hypothetical protein
VTQPNDGATSSRARIVAALVTAAQALTLLGLSVFSILETIDGRADDAFSAYLLGGLGLLTGGGLGWIAWSLWRGARWARSPSLVWQLVMLPVGYETLDTRQWIGFALLVSAAAALVSLLAIERDDPDV